MVGLEPKWSVLEGGQGRKVAQARIGGQAPNAPNAGLALLAPLCPTALKPNLDFFKRYMYMSDGKNDKSWKEQIQTVTPQGFWQFLVGKTFVTEWFELFPM